MTKRPELVAQTTAAITLATIRAHTCEFFPRDRAESYLTYTPTNTVFVDIPNIYTTIPRLRTIESLFGVDASSNLPVEAFEFRTRFEDFWQDNALAHSSYTLVGDTLRLAPQVQSGKLRMIQFSLPVAIETGYSSWIADMHPDSLAQWAAGIVWARSGNEEMARNAQADVEGFKEILKSSYLMNKV
jgi:hypothetical protein